jgi:hypothetical protein
LNFHPCIRKLRFQLIDFVFHYAPYVVAVDNDTTNLHG